MTFRAGYVVRSQSGASDAGASSAMTTSPSLLEGISRKIMTDFLTSRG
jgi:hypothetical protein